MVEKAMKTEYPIWTIQDMMEIPLPRFNAFLGELIHALSLARTSAAYNKVMEYKDPPIIHGPFVWDDDKVEIRTNITWKQKEEDKA